MMLSGGAFSYSLTARHGFGSVRLQTCFAMTP
jgi:hypothetical protein